MTRTAAAGIVTNELIHDTDNPGSQPVTESVDVEILTQVTTFDMVTTAMEMIDALAATAEGADADQLAAATAWLVKATEAEWWVDGDTLAKPGGVRVYKRMRKAMNELQLIGAGSALFADAQSVVWLLADAGEDVTQHAIDRAITDGASADDVAEATRRYDNANQSYNNGLAKRSVKRYQTAWKAATRYLD